MEKINFQYPVWYIAFAVVAGLVYALIMYYKDKSFRENSKALVWILGFIRFLAVSVISVLLMTPLLKTIITETKKPVIILAQDESESIAAELGDNELKEYKEAMLSLSKDLEGDFDLKKYDFGSTVREGLNLKFEDKTSNISQLLSNISDVYGGQNLRGVILATDGIYNEGSNPLYSAFNLAAPVYSIALGDTIPKKDLILKRVFFNKIAYLGDKFSVQVDILGRNCKGEAVSLNVNTIENGKLRKIEQIPLSIDNDDFFTTKEVILEADSPGVQQFRFSVTKAKDEVTVANNSKDIFIDVLDARQKILILANSPHPDVEALKQIILTNKNYEVSVRYMPALTEAVVNYDFVIFHQLPSKISGISTILNQLTQNKIPSLFIVGTQTDIAQFNQSQPVVSIQGDGKNTNDVQAMVANNFNIFILDENLAHDLTNFPPLLSPFGDFKMKGSSTTLLFQKIGNVETKYPLFSFGENNGIKTGVLLGEGLWRWRLFDYLQRQNHDLITGLITKSIQYLTVKDDKRKFRISLDKNIFKENEPILFQAELYNENFELINDADVSLKIFNEDGREFNFTFNKAGNSYSLDAGIFPVGNYSFKGIVFRNGKELIYNGKFNVSPIQLELFETTANHGLLRLLSDKYGGEVVYPNNISKITELIKSNTTIKPIIYQTTKTQPAINLKWIFLLLAGLLTVEWFLRRYFGGY